ncbi:Hypothetical Protein FCC1311_047052 [Hondaea fermentalgiana]|uniref:Mediator of RNA polymerase II transcription subunit 17 n=1 Tax=Hondaea fermentalgiana TaxID=2315210 RepID=A0A2R5GBW0_9STRA|nr:Hypothetical Protein FCC1311_047052 [Hondaea fermentalgiana]|eukprot:GBG28482.1 Hypothetical Protein FCC1311_047052 [Hondaea fermentalgiana]
MVQLDVVPETEEVLEVNADGTERLLPPATAADAFAASVKRLELHKRCGKRRRVEQAAKAMDVDEAADAGSGEKDGDDPESEKKIGAQDQDEPPSRVGNPFEEVHRQLSYACYELTQLNELTGLLCDKSLFRLESLQADERSAFATLEDSLMAFEMKKVGLRTVLGILRSGKKMLQGSQHVQQAYLMFIQNIQARWRMQAIAHGNFASGLRAQEPLAVDCGFYSAGSRGKATRQRQTRNAARLIVDEDCVHGLNPNRSDEALRLDVDTDSFRRLCFEVLDARTGKSLACAFLGPSLLAAAAPTSETRDGASVNLTSAEAKVEAQLEGLQANEFCIEVFQVLSVEAVRGGELCSYAEARDRPDVAPSYRPKVVVVENLLRSVSVALDERRHLRVTLQRFTGEQDAQGAETPQAQNSMLEDYCRAAVMIAEQYQRSLQTLQARNSHLLKPLVNKYRQMDARARISDALHGVAGALCANPLHGRPRKLVRIQHAWTHAGDDAFLEVWVGPRVLMRCLLTAGELKLVSLAKQGGSLGHLAPIQEAGDHQLATPGSELKLCALVVSIAVYEIMMSLEAAMIMLEPTCRIRWAPDGQSAELVWADDSVNNTLRVAFEDRSLHICLGNGEPIANTTLQGIARRALLHARQGKACLPGAR